MAIVATDKRAGFQLMRFICSSVALIGKNEA